MAPEPCADHNISLPLKIQNMTMCVCFQSKACEAHLFIEFSRQEYGCGLPFPPPGDLPDPEIEPTSPVSLALAGGFFTTEPPGKS